MRDDTATNPVKGLTVKQLSMLMDQTSLAHLLLKLICVFVRRQDLYCWKVKARALQVAQELCVP